LSKNKIGRDMNSFQCYLQYWKRENMIYNKSKQTNIVPLFMSTCLWNLFLYLCLWLCDKTQWVEACSSVMS
jgi:hypothetical protein